MKGFFSIPVLNFGIRYLYSTNSSTQRVFYHRLFYVFQRINYTKGDSDAIAKIKGTFVERPKKEAAAKKKQQSESKKEKKRRLESAKAVAVGALSCGGYLSDYYN